MNQRIYSAVSMFKFGIKTVVLVEHQRLEWYLNEYKTQPDFRFGCGLGKKKMYELYKKILPKEDEYFDINPDEAVSTNQRWLDFCDDCIILATLGSYLNGTQILLVHPDSYDSREGINSKYEDLEIAPTLISEISVLQ